ncbi:MAG: hypothetical protein KF708_19670 [Pirellulales bacterium]|nr:hypothetical protein [Pirellulales bacterium]
MADYVPSVLGSVMKAVACTPNKNFDDAEYNKGVIEPARRIRRMMEELGDAPPSTAQIREAISLLLTIFETKQVDMEEREDRLREILELHQLEAVFPDLLPLARSSGR